MKFLLPEISIAIRRIAVREAGVSLHHGVSIRGPLKPLIDHNNTALRGLRGVSFIPRGISLCMRMLETGKREGGGEGTEGGGGSRGGEGDIFQTRGEEEESRNFSHVHHVLDLANIWTDTNIVTQYRHNIVTRNNRSEP